MSILSTVFAVSSAYTYSTSSGTNSAASGVLFMVLGVSALGLVVLMIASLWKMFTKAGKPGWAAIVPVYNGWVLAEIGGKPGWWSLLALLSFIPFVGAIIALIFSVLITLGVAKNFGKSTAFAVVGLILFPFVGFPMLGFGKASYNAQLGAATPGQSPVGAAVADFTQPITTEAPVVPQQPQTPEQQAQASPQDPSQPTPPANPTA